jgi:hypothetical protein
LRYRNWADFTTATSGAQPEPRSPRRNYYAGTSVSNSWLPGTAKTLQIANLSSWISCVRRLHPAKRRWIEHLACSTLCRPPVQMAFAVGTIPAETFQRTFQTLPLPRVDNSTFIRELSLSGPLYPVKELQRSHDELRGTLIPAARTIIKLSFGRRNDPVLEILRRVLVRDARIVARRARPARIELFGRPEEGQEGIAPVSTTASERIYRV